MNGRTERPLARASAHASAGRFAQAEGAYNAVLSIDPGALAAYFGIADCAVALGRLDDAVQRLVDGAGAFVERGDTRGAFALLTKALAIAPSRMELHIDVAELEAATGRPELAVARLENLSRAYAANGDHEDAEMVLLAADTFRPTPPPAPPVPRGRPPFIDPATGREAVAKPVSRMPPVPPRTGKTLSPSSPPPAPQSAVVRKAKRASGPRRSAPQWRPPTGAVKAVPAQTAKRPAKAKAKAKPQPSAKKAKPTPIRVTPAKAPSRAAPKAKAGARAAAPKKAAKSAAKRVRISVAKAPRPKKPQRPSVPALASIAPAPSPSRGGKRLAQLPPLQARDLAAQLRRAAIIPGHPAARADFAEEEATSLWQRPHA